MPEIGSTNLELSQRVREGLGGAGTVLVTDHQVTGRGRLERVWEVPFGAALTFSVVVRPSVPTADWGWLPLVVGVAVHRALQPLLGDAVGLKWPNDVMVAERKLAGILAEVVPVPTGSTPQMYAVLGIGINVDTRAEELPVTHATSLAVSGVQVAREDLLVEILRHLGDLLAQWESGDVEGIPAAYRAACVTVGRQVSVHLPGEERAEGQAVSVDSAGRLVVATSRGEQAYAAGDVIHVRPAVDR